MTVNRPQQVPKARERSMALNNLFQFTKICKDFDFDDCLFLGLNFCIVVHAYTSISPTDIHKTKH
jgi:hypothetical protein